MKDHLRLDCSRLLGFKLTAQSSAQQKLSDPRLGAKIGKIVGIKTRRTTDRRSA